VREVLLEWYRRSRRDLPWRKTRDPYAIWVSEIMLQQTRVETVIPYWQRWMASFPTVQALAAAPLDEVLRHWAGLGYYSRARNLHRAAQQIGGGKIPDTVEGLLELPGVGRYTAGAIASIAFGREAPLVDGNVERVFARLFLIEDRAAAWKKAEELRPTGDLNQALMELGATICTPRNPTCLVCPVMKVCEARALGIQEQVPAKRVAKAVPVIDAAVLVLRRRGEVLLCRRPARGLWGGLWEFPTGELLGKRRHGAMAPWADAARRVGLRVRARHVGLVEHTLTHRHMRFHVYRGSAAGRIRLDGYEDYRWVGPDELVAAAISTATRRVWESAT
jgi:A/G-specific adenine glycosylase